MQTKMWHYQISALWSNPIFEPWAIANWSTKHACSEISRGDNAISDVKPIHRSSFTVCWNSGGSIPFGTLSNPEFQNPGKPKENHGDPVLHPPSSHFVCNLQVSLGLRIHVSWPCCCKLWCQGVTVLWLLHSGILRWMLHLEPPVSYSETDITVITPDKLMFGRYHLRVSGTFSSRTPSYPEGGIWVPDVPAPPPPKINISPENGPFQKENSLATSIFQGMFSGK